MFMLCFWRVVSVHFGSPLLAIMLPRVKHVFK
jgi:hypothetical protein